MISEGLLQRYYSDPKYDGTLRFFSWVRSYASSKSRVLNLGAGPATNDVRTICKGDVGELIGADIDPIVLTNPELDQAVVIENDVLPFSDSSFDLVFSNYVLEHVERPSQFLREVHRVLRPGGHFFFRTPNIYHYATIIARITPHWFHKAIANSARGLSEDAHEPWSTFFRLNSRRRIRRAAQEASFKFVELQMVEGHPSYLMFHMIPFLLGVSYERCVNSHESFCGLRSNIFGRLSK